MDFSVTTLIVLLTGGLFAGFTSGFAGFGMGLVSAGFWFYILPASDVPPVIVLTTVIAQLVSLVTVRPSFDWSESRPFLVGGAIGVMPGVWALTMISPRVLKLTVGMLILIYCIWQLAPTAKTIIRDRMNSVANGIVGLSGGFLGGFAGLPAPIPLMWLQLHNRTNGQNRAIYQTFNLLILVFAAIILWFAGHLSESVVGTTIRVAPAVILGSYLGAKCYRKTSEKLFKLLVLGLLILSATVLVSTSI
ncbi:MAG: sulfite exporter TauE/SafE family protein [Pseudomonadota bacterium]